MVRRLAVALPLVLAAALQPAISSAAPATSAPLAASVARAAAVAPAGARPDQGFGPAARAQALGQAREHAPEMARALGLSRAEGLHARSVERDVNGTEHIRYDRTVHGLPVIGGDLVVHQSSLGRVIDADYAADEPLRAVPTTAVVPAARAIKAVGARQQMAHGTVGDATLVVWAISGLPRPAWQVSVKGVDATGAPVSRLEYVDATTGRHIAGWSRLETASGTGRSLYHGTVGLTTVKKDGKFLLKDGARGGSTTVDVHNKWDGRTYLAGDVFKDADNKWGTGTTKSRQTAAVDAAYGAAKTWDYYKTTFGRSGIAGNGKGAKSRVHFGKAFDNAFWDDGCFCMTYGDGGQYFRPVVSLDVAGHEMTHGVTSRTAGLYYFGDPGGLNEASSDIFGTMVEFSVANAKDPGDYLIGEKVVKASTFGTPWLRRMDNPHRDGYSYNCWSSTMGRQDPHYTSGPANHFFYLLAEGSGAKTINGVSYNSPTCNGSSLTGIGRDSAAAIWYRALTTYMTSTSGYVDARDATIRAALDLDATQCATVEQTWDAVKVPAGSWSCAGGQLDEGTNVVANPGFESGAVSWTANTHADITNDLHTGIPHRGHWWVNLNGLGSANTARVSQTVTVPGTSTPTLRFWLLDTTAKPGSVHATFQVKVNGTQVWATDNRYANDTYMRHTVSLDPSLAGTAVTISFVGQQLDSSYTQFLVDDVSLTDR